MARSKSVFGILFLVLIWTCSLFKECSGFKNDTVSSAASSSAFKNGSASASSSATMQHNRTLKHDTHTVENSVQSGSASSIATTKTQQGDASSKSDTKARRKYQNVESDNSLISSIKHIISHSRTQILMSEQEGLVTDDEPDMPSAVTYCESPTRCVAKAVSQTSSKKPVLTVALADAQVMPEFAQLLQPLASRLCTDPYSCQPEPRSPGIQHRTPGYVISGRELSRAIERLGLVQEFHNTLHELDNSRYYRWMSVPIKVLLAKMVTLSRSERTGFMGRCVLRKLIAHIDETYNLRRRQILLRMSHKSSEPQIHTDRRYSWNT